MRLTRRINSAVQFLYALCSRRGFYRFLIGRWKFISDIDLAVDILGTEFFRHKTYPLPLPVKEIRSVLVISPHQDDETIGAGGTLLLAGRAGVKIDVLYITDGMQVGLYPAGESIEMRDREAQEVCDRLGASIHRLGISNYEPRPTKDDLRTFADIFNGLKPQVVMIPWVLDRPARHRLTNHLLWLANRCSALPNCEVWGYQVHNTLYPNGYVDITEVADDKREMLRCYESQNRFVRYDHLAMGMSAWNLRFLPGYLQNEARYVEVFFRLSMQEHLSLVESFYFKELSAVYRGSSSVLSGMSAIHNAVMEDASGRAK